MKAMYFMLLLIVIASCAKNQVEIKTADINKAETDSASITTAEGKTEEATQYLPKVPEIKIIIPKDGEIINKNTIIVVLNVSNFKLASPDRYPKKGEGQIQVRIDNFRLQDSNTIFTFENESNGTHIITANLMMSNNTLLPYNDTIRVYVNSKVTDEMQQNGTEEFTVEADDKDFYPNTLKAKINESVKINFRFRDNSVYYAGLDVKGPFEDVMYKIKGAQPITRQFTMRGETRIDSYWPSSGVHKATLIVEVEK